MILNLQQTKQILQYNSNRLYYGNWSGKMLDNCYNQAMQTNEPQQIYVGNLNNDIICDALWHEMSYNPVRFETKSPFVLNTKNNLLYFNTTYKQTVSSKTKDFLPDEIINFVWNISVFVKKLKKAGLYDNFAQTGKLPNHFNITKAKSLTYGALGFGTEHSILTSLMGAINAIAKQNCLDLFKPEYQEKIIQTAQKRHPTGKRSDICYMTLESVTNPKTDDLTIINEKITKTEAEIKSLENEIDNFLQMGFHQSFYTLCPELDKLKSQYTALCEQKQNLLNTQPQNSGR